MASLSRNINRKPFYEYGKDFIKFLKQLSIFYRNKAMNFMNIHKAHLFNLEFIQLMKKNIVEVCGFLPHCTHILQPLDNVTFGNFKHRYQILPVINQLMSGNKISRQQFFRIFVPVFEGWLIIKAIRKSFKNASIYPIDRKVTKLQNIVTSTKFDRCKKLLGS